MKRFFKRIAARLPFRWQQQLKRTLFASQIRKGRFHTDEPEYALLSALVSPGDWVFDIGANIGHYTMRFSELVGGDGRVFSFEPVPETFELLAANAALTTTKNVTLINAAVSDSAGLLGMEVPQLDTGLDNYYMAHSAGGNGAFRVARIAVDSLAFPHPIGLAKIDTEGHELLVLKGMAGILKRDHPLLIVEDNVPEIIPFLGGLGYSTFKITGSSNRIFCCGPSSTETVRSLVEKGMAPGRQP
jgi:FkbM family methyltransferase